MGNAVILLLSMIAGCHNPTPANKQLSGLHPAAKLDLVSGGRSVYTIVIPDDPLPADRRAATILQKYLGQISGASLPVIGESDFKKAGAAAAVGASGRSDGSGRSDAASGRMAIYLGRTAEASAAYDFSKVRDDGFFIATNASAVFIAGVHGKGTVYGVYDFLDHYLGCRKFSAGPAYVPHASSLQIDTHLFDLQNPAFIYRQSYYPQSNDPEYLEWHHLHQFEDLWGVWGHSYFKFVNPKDYFSTHPEYFAQVNGKRAPMQLCLSNEAVFELTVEYLRKKMVEHPDALYWSVSPQDDNGYCTCDLCRKADAEEGGPQGSLIRFVNRIAARFPDKSITTLAYGYTSHAPQKTRPASNVYIMLSSIDAMRNQPLERAHSASTFRDNLKAWSAITSHLMVWDYTTQFTNYLAPFPDYPNLQPNLNYFKQYSVRGVFEQGSGDTYGDMAEYNSYLQASLLWNPGADVHRLTTEFCEGYYGAAGKFVAQYIGAIGAAACEGAGTGRPPDAAGAGRPLDIYGNPVNEYNSFLTPEAIDQYSTLLDKGEAAVEANAELLARVHAARLPLEYTVLQQSRFYGLEPHGYLVSDEQGGYKARTNWPSRVDRFVATCRESGVSELAEGGLTPEVYASEWKEIFARGWEKNNALGAKVSFLYPFAEDYPAKGARTLTDGVTGYKDFSYNWLCFYGVDMVATIDMGGVQPVNQVHLHFLDDPRHWIFLPRQVRVETSEDGMAYTTAGTYSYPIEEEDYAVTINNRLFRMPSALKARFIRVSATVPPALPSWRVSETKKPMICSDEIYVQYIGSNP